ncbi:hypothetical protein ACFLYO_05800 [Chloroflexota bacterium]
MKILKWFTLDDRQALIPMIVAVVCVAVARLVLREYEIGLRNLSDSGVKDALCIPVCFQIIPAYISILGFLVLFSIWRTRSLLPTILLSVGIYLAIFIPLERPDTPEKLHFLEHRADYEAVVELARNGELIAEPDTHSVFPPPEEYFHVSKAGSMYVYHYGERGLFVLFHPFTSFYFNVAYIEHDESIGSRCDSDSVVEQKIDDHWYVCEVDWN